MPPPRKSGGETAPTPPPPAAARKVPAKLTGGRKKKELRPKLPAATQFVYIHHWAQWQVQAGQLVPALSPVRLHAGLNGTRVAKNGDINARGYLGKKEDDGWLILDDYTATEDGESYVRMVINDRDEEVWLDRWGTPVPGSDTVVPDERAYVAWLRWLVAAGTIPDIQPHVLDALEQVVESKMLAAQQAAAAAPTVGPRAERFAADLQVVRAYKREQEAANV